jgi:hypothetical protein
MQDKIREFEVLSGYGGWRLDRFLVAMLPRLSRNRAQHLIDTSVALSSGRKARASRQVWLGEISPRPSPKRPPSFSKGRCLFYLMTTSCKRSTSQPRWPVIRALVISQGQ